MVRAIIHVVIVLLLGILVLFNAGYTTGISLFGYVFERVPVVAVAILSFVLGALYTFAYCLYGRARSKKDVRSTAREERPPTPPAGED